MVLRVTHKYTILFNGGKTEEKVMQYTAGGAITDKYLLDCASDDAKRIKSENPDIKNVVFNMDDIRIQILYPSQDTTEN